PPRVNNLASKWPTIPKAPAFHNQPSHFAVWRLFVSRRVTLTTHGSSGSRRSLGGTVEPKALSEQRQRGDSTKLLHGGRRAAASRWPRGGGSGCIAAANLASAKTDFLRFNALTI